jgi:hypothetical protein
LKKKHQEI